MDITPTMVKELRSKTGYGFKLCRDALKESNGDVDKAVEILRKKGEGKAAKMSDRATNEGIIGSYIHFNKQLGVIVEIATQTDSLAQSDEVIEFADSVAMHIAFTKPTYISREDVPEDVVEAEKKIYREGMEDSGKPDFVVDKIVTGKLDKFFEENCLLEQKYIQNEDVTIGDWMKKIAAQGHENVQVRRLHWLEVGK